MFVGSLKYDKEKVKSLNGDTGGMREYAKSLIPEELRHNDSLVANQLYYIYTDVAKDTSLSMEVRKELADTLMYRIKIVGYLNSFVPITDMIRFVNRNKLERLYKGESK